MKWIVGLITAPNAYQVYSVESRWDLLNLKDLLEPFSTSSYISLDCEWEQRAPHGDKRVDVMQIATRGRVVVIRTAVLLQSPKSARRLIDLLKNDKITKVGVGIEEDVKRIKSWLGIETRGWLDLRYCALLYDDFNFVGSILEQLRQFEVRLNAVEREKGQSFGHRRRNWIPKLSLSSLTSALLHSDMEEYCDNVHVEFYWDAHQLNQYQIGYAAQDAAIGFKIYKRILKSKKCTCFQEEFIEKPCLSSEVQRMSRLLINQQFLHAIPPSYYDRQDSDRNHQKLRDGCSCNTKEKNRYPLPSAFSIIIMGICIFFACLFVKSTHG